MAERNPTPSTGKPQSQSDGAPIFHNATIYAGDLDPDVNEEDLVEKFRFVGPIASVRLCRDALTGKSLRYAYVNFFSHSDASKALRCLNHTQVKGKPMRLMWSQRDPLARKNGIGNVFVKNLDSSITSAQLQDIFAKFGNIMSCKVAEENGASKGFGFVQFDSEESATNAISSLHDTEVYCKKLFVSKFVKKSERMTPVKEDIRFTNPFVKYRDFDVTEDITQDTFSHFGKVCIASIIRDEKGDSTGFGFVEFDSPESAMNAACAMNGSVLGSKLLLVERALQKDGKKSVIKYLASSVSLTHSQGLQNLLFCYPKNIPHAFDNLIVMLMRACECGLCRSDQRERSMFDEIRRCTLTNATFPKKFLNGNEAMFCQVLIQAVIGCVEPVESFKEFYVKVERSNPNVKKCIAGAYARTIHYVELCQDFKASHSARLSEFFNKLADIGCLTSSELLRNLTLTPRLRCLVQYVFEDFIRRQGIDRFVRTLKRLKTSNSLWQQMFPDRELAKKMFEDLKLNSTNNFFE